MFPQQHIPPLDRRKLFRFIAYIFLGICLILLLILYLLYLSAQSQPEFYKKALNTAPETHQMHRKEMVHKIGQLNNDLQKPSKEWSANFSEENLNGYFAVELAEAGSSFLPPEMKNPRLSFSKQQINFACRFEQGAASGILNLGVLMTLPEPNRLEFKIKSAKLGSLPISKKTPAQELAKALQRQGYQVKTDFSGSEPTIQLTLDIRFMKKYAVLLNALSVQDGTLQISGSSKKTELQKVK